MLKLTRYFFPPFMFEMGSVCRKTFYLEDIDNEYVLFFKNKLVFYLFVSQDQLN